MSLVKEDEIVMSNEGADELMRQAMRALHGWWVKPMEANQMALHVLHLLADREKLIRKIDSLSALLPPATAGSDSTLVH